MKFTEGQALVLETAAAFGASKGNFDGKYWRNFDQLERRGLIQRGNFVALYFLTDKGKEVVHAIMARA